MDDIKIISFEAAKLERKKKSVAAALVEIGRLIQQIEDDELREKLGEAWRNASITFFASPFSLSLHE